MIKTLSKHIGKFKIYAILAPITVALEAVLEVFIPRVMTIIIDDGIGNSDMQIVWQYGALMILMALCAMACGVACGVFTATAGVGFANNLREAEFAKTQDFSFANIDKFSTGSLVTRLTTDVTYVRNAFIMVIKIGVRAPAIFIASMIMVITIEPIIALIFMAFLPIAIAIVCIMAKFVFPLFDKMFKKFDIMNNKVQECLTAIRVVKAFSREGHETEEFRHASREVQQTQLRAEKLMVIATPLATCAMYACMLTVLWMGGDFIIEGSMTSGELASLITYVGLILMSVVMVSNIIINVIMSRASAKRICEVLNEEPDISDENCDASLAVEDGSIAFKDVQFSYFKDDNNLILNGVNLTINSGETVGIIGSTGSAKTTLVQLVSRLYDVQGGSVVVGGHDVRDYKLKVLRDASAMVLQQNILFSGTIRENLLWGNAGATEDMMREACKNADADDFVMSFPKQYDTDLGQGGVNVSGGQKQRLCIARALLKKPKIMILDDSTSAVDTATDAKIRASFKENLADTTVIIIAQRVQSVKDADKIIIMNEGAIDAIGTHEELLKTNEIYKDINASQQKGVGIDG
ncbi:MAG: ABC transporter ATP-binding protein [Bacillota bacterium]